LGNDSQLAAYTNLAVVNFPASDFEFSRTDKLDCVSLRAWVPRRADSCVIVREEFLEKARVASLGSLYDFIIQPLQFGFDGVCSGRFCFLIGLSHYQTAQEHN